MGSGIATGAVLGLAYFQLSESSVPTEANCSYLATPSTDFLAFAGGAWCAKRGAELGDQTIAAFGAAVVAIHLMQYLRHKS